MKIENNTDFIIMKNMNKIGYDLRIMKNTNENTRKFISLCNMRVGE